MKHLALMGAMLLVWGCSDSAQQIQLNTTAMADAPTFAMNQLTAEDCDSFFVVSPYQAQRLDSMHFEVSDQLRSLIKWNAQAREDIATILFTKSQVVVAYAEVPWRPLDFRDFPSLKGYAMSQPFAVKDGKVVTTYQRSD